jgi:Ca2+-binding RTX toxin-like protein
MRLPVRLVLAASTGTVVALLLASGSGGAPTESICGSNADYTVESGVPYTDSPGAHTIQGSPDGDVIHAGGRGDTVCAYGGSDTVYGGKGPDILFGEEGDDQLRGGRGADSLHGGPGEHDSCLGGLPRASRGRDPDTAAGGCEKVRGAR